MPDNCTNEFPTTNALYQYITSETSVLVLTILVGVVTCVTICVFVEELWFLFPNYRNASKRTKIILLLALYPIVSFASLLCLLVPTSTILGEFVSSIYLSFCIFIFVNLSIEYFGGLNMMIEMYGEQTMSFRTGPCCCFCVCVNAVPLTRRNMTKVKCLVLQVAILRPCFMFILAVLWSDDLYSLQEQNDFTKPAAYLNMVNAASTLLAVYGLVVTFKTTRDKLQVYRLTPKFISLQGTILFMNLQSFITSFLGRSGLPYCLESMGSPVRASRVNHFLLIPEMLLFAILARFAYRNVEEGLPLNDKDQRKQYNTMDTNSHENGITATEFDGINTAKLDISNPNEVHL